MAGRLDLAGRPGPESPQMPPRRRSTSSTAPASSTAPSTRSAASPPASGLPTNATYGFTTMLRKLLEDEHPEHVAVLFDPPGKTFRHEEYAEYKANRPKMDDDLAVQLPYIRRVCEALRMPVVEVPGYEADDTIATLARQAVEQGLRGGRGLRRQGPAPARDGGRRRPQPRPRGQRRHALRPQGRRGEVGRAPRAHRRRARPRGRLRRQRARRRPASATRARATSSASSARSRASSSTPTR